MNVIEFVQSIYLGDRACQKLIFDGVNRTVSIQVDVISRIRSPDGQWNFYSDEDLKGGSIVFSDVSSINWSNSDKIPNDYIGHLRTDGQIGTRHVFYFSADSVDPDGSNHEVVLKIVARGIHLTDPARPGVKIAN